MRVVGINHVALEAGDLEEALTWYRRFFEFELRGRAGTAMAFIDMGDQFIAIAAGRTQPPDQAPHFGLVVDDKQVVRAALRAAGVSASAAHRIDLATPTNRALWPLLAAVLIGVAAFGLAGLLKRRPIGTSA